MTGETFYQGIAVEISTNLMHSSDYGTLSLNPLAESNAIQNLSAILDEISENNRIL